MKLTVELATTDRSLVHLKLALAMLLYGLALALGRESVASTLENLRVNVVAARLSAVVKTTVFATVKLALATLNADKRARLGKRLNVVATLWSATRRLLAALGALGALAALAKEKF